jgi:signal transduction histidine kinase
LSLIQNNRIKHQNTPAFIESTFETIRHSAEKINKLLTQMNAKNLSFKTEHINLRAIIEKVIKLTSHRQPVAQLLWHIDAEELSILGDEEVLTNILSHLVENAQQATALYGEITISVRLRDQSLVIAIVDSGCGMDPEFIHVCLFKPFTSTKSNQGMGIGVYQAKEYCYTLGGSLNVESIKGQGSIFSLSFPQTIMASELHVA